MARNKKCPSCGGKKFEYHGVGLKFVVGHALGRLFNPVKAVEAVQMEVRKGKVPASKVISCRSCNALVTICPGCRGVFTLSRAPAFGSPMLCRGCGVEYLDNFSSDVGYVDVEKHFDLK